MPRPRLTPEERRARARLRALRWRRAPGIGPRSLFHVTTADNAALILAEGFKDGRGNYMATLVYEGVWLSHEPLDCNEGAEGDTVLEVIFDCALDALDGWEWVEENKPYREWLVPAEFINRNATVRLSPPDDEMAECEDSN